MKNNNSKRILNDRQYQKFQERERERESNSSLVEAVWDYTKHAKYYSYRPNYADSAIDLLCFYALNGKEKPLIADIGAGSGNLSIMLLQRNQKVVAIEPNDAMREVGIKRTKDKNITWVRANGINTTQKDKSFDWVTFGSSFNVMDRDEALKETYRILKDDGVFTCMWNHRDLDDPIQECATEVIKSLVPNYSTGVRREDQRPVIAKNRHLFDEIFYLEYDFYFTQSIENYILAWKSVKNPYWDLETKKGQDLFEKISYKLQHELPSKFDIKYTTRSWSAKKV